MRWEQTLSDGESELSDLSREILSVMADKPTAQDTLEGIAEWWLLERDLIREVDKIRRALAHLVAKGWVLEKPGPDGRSRFAVNVERLVEIRDLIGGKPD